MRPIKRLIQMDEALRLAMSEVHPVRRRDTVGLLEAPGRVAAEDVIAESYVPPFTRSAMDGYAVRSADTLGSSRMKPIRLSKIDVIYAGLVPKKTISRRDCAEIATGAMLPKGADSVVMVEDTELDGTHVQVFQPVHKGQNVSRRGEDIARGMKIIRAGDLLNPSKVGALAAIGREKVSVYRKPKVAVVPTGNEIAPLGGVLEPGQVYNINSYTLGSVIRANGADALMIDITGDTLPELERVINSNSDCDMIVFSGGSSVGVRDIILDALEKNGRVIFHGVAIKPGKPTIFGTVGKQLIFGMPGYPTACLSNAYIVLAPVLRKMAGLPDARPAAVEARMAKRVVSTTGRTQFLTVKLEDGLALPAFKESGAITSMAFADGYIVIPADVDLVERNEKVTVHLL